MDVTEKRNCANAAELKIVNEKPAKTQNNALVPSLLIASSFVAALKSVMRL